MEIGKPGYVGKIKRHQITILFRDSRLVVHMVCDLAFPDQSGSVFVVRDLTGGEKAPVDWFYPIGTITHIKSVEMQYELLSNGERGKVIDIYPPRDENNGMEEKKDAVQDQKEG